MIKKKVQEVQQLERKNSFLIIHSIEKLKKKGSFFICKDEIKKDLLNLFD